ncbi:hypothetical protein Dsin_018606 [Dipteronia sinensis]|uniref:Endonuclease/exonuclease/phosphatase domain-containing protein n=1 Tax=Dipteronia sinensis TaxID=43782 RepID=A0AAE0A5W2_9ROSI|nr:hypothetical protein Dsin_018606 [Dipteronia sinensis]
MKWTMDQCNMSEKPALDVYRPDQLLQVIFSSFGKVEKPASKGEACPYGIFEGQKVHLEEVSSLKNSVFPHNKGAHHDPLMDPPSSRPMNIKYYQPFHNGNRKCVSPSLKVAEERVVDTSNKFAALVEDGDYRNAQCNDQSNDQVFKDWDMIDSYNSHSLGRIWVGWDPRILNITKISETDQIVHCNACILDTNDQFRISFVYGSNDDRLRKALWQSTCSSQHGSPWIILGDFNVSKSMGVSIGGCSRISGAMEEFNDCLQSSELDDLRFTGFLHTWCNKRSNGCISRKLDRVLVNNDWLVKSENSEAIFLPPSISDHCPSMVKLGLQELISCYTSTLKVEEDILRQKSRIQWLKAGDRNSSYFFKAINGKRNRSKIHTITGDDGSLTEGDILVKKEAIHHFQTILGCPRPVSHGIGSTLRNIIDKVISNRQADFMGRDVTDDEIREVCFSLYPNKAPGRDGFNFHFFKITWDIVGEDVISVVQEFFRSGLLLKKLNATILVLVSKVPNPSKMKDFRPISCCNTLYKIIAKIIANRIKSCLPDIINPSQ